MTQITQTAAQDYFDMALERRTLHHELQMKMAEQYELRATADGEKWADTGLPRIEEIRLRMEELDIQMNFALDCLLNDYQVSYDRTDSRDAVYLDDFDTMDSIRAEMRP